MWSFVNDPPQQSWLWRAIDRQTGVPLAVVLIRENTGLWTNCGFTGAVPLDSGHYRAWKNPAFPLSRRNYPCDSGSTPLPAPPRRGPGKISSKIFTKVLARRGNRGYNRNCPYLENKVQSPREVLRSLREIRVHTPPASRYKE